MSMSNPWYEARVFAPVNRPIIYFTTNGKAGVLKGVRHDWKWLREKYAIEYWAYQSEIRMQVNDVELWKK